MKKRYFAVPLLVAGTCLLHTGCETTDYYLDDLNTDSVMVTTGVGAPIGDTNIDFPTLFKHDGIKGELKLADGSTISFEKYGLDNDIPFPLTVNEFNIAATDTITDVNLSDYLGEGNAVRTLDLAKLQFSVDNSMPAEARIQIFWVKTDTVLGLPVKSVINDPAINQVVYASAGKLDSEGNVTATVHTDSTLRFTNDMVPSLRKATDLIFSYSFAKPEGVETVKLTEDQNIKVSIKAYAKGDVLVNEF